MQHVYGHTGNLGDECADHAAALGTFGLVSNHTYLHVGFVITLIPLLVLVLATTMETSWKIRNIRTETASLPQDGS